MNLGDATHEVVEPEHSIGGEPGEPATVRGRSDLAESSHGRREIDATIVGGSFRRSEDSAGADRHHPWLPTEVEPPRRGLQSRDPGDRDADPRVEDGSGSVVEAGRDHLRLRVGSSEAGDHSFQIQRDDPVTGQGGMEHDAPVRGA